MKRAPSLSTLSAVLALLCCAIVAWTSPARAAAPVLNPIANLVLSEGCQWDQGISGSDPDGDPLTFTKAAGPTYMTVTTTSPTTGNIHLVPGFSDGGVAPATVTASDGTLSDSKSFTIQVTDADRAPVLNQPANMTVAGGSTADQTITGSDPDVCDRFLTFAKVSGPTFMTVTTTNATSGNVHLTPTISSSGTFGATVNVSDGFLSDSKSFTITTFSPEIPPTLGQPANMTVDEGLTADQALNASDANGDPLSFSKESGPTFMSVTTTSPGSGTATGNVHLAPGFTDTGSYLATVGVTDGFFSPVAKSVRSPIGNCHARPALVQPANMTVIEGKTADQTVVATDACGSALTFQLVSGPTFVTVTTTNPGAGTATGNVHLAPGLADLGTFTAILRVTNGALSSDKPFTITCRLGPTLSQPADMTVDQGTTADQTLHATDPDGNPLTFSRAQGPLFVTVSTTDPGHGTATGNVRVAPSFADAGNYNVTVSVASVFPLTDSKTFRITVVHRDFCPVANPGGPYSGLVNVPLSFNGTGSVDADGDPLTYSWNFGDGTTGTGVTPSHTYTSGGNFSVALTVTDPLLCSGSASTTATILTACDATVFNGYDVIRLNSGRPLWFAFVQPSSSCYANTDVVLPSFVLKYAGRQIPADVSKTTLDSDKSGDGIQEIRVTFSKANLRTLFAGLPNGHTMAEVTVEANLTTGGLLSGTTTVDVVSNGSFTAAEVSPNPFNPEATLSFSTDRDGPCRVELFDASGRRVRTILDEGALAAGMHVMKLDGRGSRGEPLPSGVYFVRVLSAEGRFDQRVILLK